MRRICLVTDEIYPFTKGGIGRLVHNLIQDSLGRGAEAEWHLLFPASVSIASEQLEEYFGPRVRIHWAPPAHGWELPHRGKRVYPPPSALSTCVAHAESRQFLLKLQDLEASGRVFDVVEFPDYKGWAFCSIQEKKLGLGLATTELAVRIHSTQGILSAFEGRIVTHDRVGQFELERKAMKDADRIVSHVPGVAEFNARYYGFEDSWLGKVRVTFPPVVLNAQKASRDPTKEARDIVFASKVQECKRPDLFVRGVATFMEGVSGFSGRAIFACHPGEADYERWLRSLIPLDLRARFLFVEGGQAEREALLASQIVVIPSVYESLNLLAYEVSAAGGQLILNGACPAFGEGSRFRDGLNCRKFNGTVAGLAAVLRASWRQPPLERVNLEPDRPYWEESLPASVVSQARKPKGRRVSVVITNFNLGRFLPEALESIAGGSYDDVEVVVVDDASTDSLDQRILDDLERNGASTGVRVIWNKVNRGLSASRNIGIRAASGDYVLPLDADDRLSSGFIKLAVSALEVNPEFDIVVPTAGYFENEDLLSEGSFCDFATFLGDVPSLGMVANRFGCATTLMRRSLFDSFGYDETLTSYEDWALYLNLALAGHRFLVTNDIHFFYRRRPGSMIRGMTQERHRALLSHIHESLERPLPPAVKLFPLLLGAQGPGPAEARASPSETELIPLRHRLVSRVNRSLGRTKLGLKLPNVDQQVLDSLNAVLKRGAPEVHRRLRKIIDRS